MAGSTLASTVGGYMPSTVKEKWDPARDFAYIKIPKTNGEGALGKAYGPHMGIRSVVAMSGTFPHVLVVTSDGSFYVFGIDVERGGEGVLVRQYS
jgi:autophagy-related protein 18